MQRRRQQRPFLMLYSVQPILPLTLMVGIGCSAQQLARHREILLARWLGENFLVPFLQILSSPAGQGTYLATNACAGRIVLHLKSVVWHRSATRFSDSQGGIKILDDEYFGSRPTALSLALFICSDYLWVWNQYLCQWSQGYLSSPISWWKFLWSRSRFVTWLSLRKRISEFDFFLSKKYSV